MKHLQHVRGKWVVRVTVPDDLREIVGKRELVHYDLPPDVKARERKAIAVINSFYATIDEARVILDSRRPTLSTAAKAHYRAELQRDDQARAIKSTRHPEFERYSRSVYANKLRLLVAGRVEGDEAEALIGFAVDDLKAKGLAPDAKRSELLRLLAEVQLEALNVFAERDDGKIKVSAPTLPALIEPDREPHETTSRVNGTGATLSQVLTAFHKERAAGGSSLSAKTISEHKTAVRMFEEFMGGEVRITGVRKQDIVAYKQALLETPVRAAQRFPGLTLPQAITANKKRAVPFETLDPKTINVKWLSHLSSLLTWALKNCFIDTNPAKGVKVDTGKDEHDEPSRVNFDPADLRRIFGDAIFANPKTYGTRQWALLVALYTGARSSSEIARIKLADIYEEDGVPVIYLSGASKNKHSKRLVPIHRDLIDLGLIDYAKALRERGEVLLFPDWQPEDKINRWFLRTFLPCVGINDSRKVFHSFRHTLKTALVRSGCPRDVSDNITGHKDQSVAADYIHEAPVKRMAEALNMVNSDLPIPGLNLDHPADSTD
ncbi:MAG: site-specific integrase [Proteobacteria bacterium]|nr:site-specific integrase [Pseudomonadota bacterium]